MPSGVYLIQDNGQLVEMTSQPPPNEDHLQRLVADYPNLLAGDQINPTVPRRWLLISREVPLASEPDSGPRWSVDHLFLDQDAIPTLVEVKRASDTRIRREVVGQLLEYAANAVTYWPIETIRHYFETTCRARKVDPDQTLSDFLVGGDSDAFWVQVRTNLQAGRLRLVFVTDAMPPELRRIVEYLNQQMNPTEVLAVEVRQYVAGEGNQRVLTPLVIGSQEKTNTVKPDVKQWDEASFFPELEARHGPQAVATARTLLDWATSRRCRIWWGRGPRSGSFYAMLDLPAGPAYTFAVWTYQSVEIQFQYMAVPPFNDQAHRDELRRRLNEIPGVNISADRLAKRPSIPLQALTDEAALRQFLAAFDWYIETVRGAAAS